VSADQKSEHAPLGSDVHIRPRQSLVIACAWAALLTGAVAVWMATELRVTSSDWLPWLAIALPPVAAGGLCLARRRLLTSTGPAAVFASCTAAGANTLQLPEGQHGLGLAVAMLLLLCAGVSVILSAAITVFMISISGAASRRRAAVWTAAGLIFAALSIPSPVYVTGGPIRTIFTGNTGGENAAAACTLALLAIPLVVAGLASGRMATVLVVAWLPEAVARLLSWYVLRLSFLHFDRWYYVSWLAWLAIAVLALAEARNSSQQQPQQR
jgi:hypothetical protein